VRSTKDASVGLTRHIAFTYGPQRICCNALCPGGIGTFPAASAQWAFERQLVGIAVGGMKKVDPDEIATALPWLASAEASNVNGIVMPVDGGWKSA
jgi:NAD(P)-dependent dehydrogenase (short-subunit alcohol dehydrogenase family)